MYIYIVIVSSGEYNSYSENIHSLWTTKEKADSQAELINKKQKSRRYRNVEYAEVEKFVVSD